MWRLLIVFLGVFASAKGNFSLPAETDMACYSFRKPGDLILGGLFTITGDSTQGLCRGPASLDVVLRTAQAMEFAVEDINRRDDLLPNVTLGFDLRDDCLSEELSLWQTLSLVSPGSFGSFKGLCSVDTPVIGGNKVVGLIGTGSSGTTVSDLGSLLDVPVISHETTSEELSDPEEFANLLQTSTPDRLRPEAILDILEHFGWASVVVLYSADEEGIYGAMRFEEMAEGRNVCVAFSSCIRETVTKAEQDEIVSTMAHFDKITITVTFLNQGDELGILKAFRQADLTDRLVWISSQTLHGIFPLSNLDEVVGGGIFLEVKNEPVPGYAEYVASLALTEPGGNQSVWLTESAQMLEGNVSCSSRQCASRAGLSGEETPVVNAVRAFGYALHAYMDELCVDVQSCLHHTGIDGKQMMSHLRNVSFPFAGGRFSFNKYGDAGGGYTVNNYQDVGGKYEMVAVGTWTSLTEGLVLNETLMRWQNGSDEIPRPDCLNVCPPGSVPVAQPNKCCIGCQPCPDSHITNGTRCEGCRAVDWPNAARNLCVQIPATNLDYGDPVVIFILAVSGLGIILCALVVGVGVGCYWDHPLIKASSRELSSVNVLGLAVCFTTAVLILLPPGRVACVCAETGLALSFTFSFGATFLKVVRIYRIFTAGKKSVKRPRFTAPRTQLTMVGMILFVQMLLVTNSILTSPSKPKMVARNVPGKVTVVEIYCQVGAGFYATSLYNFLLIIGCCLAAFKARKVPSNYNESRFIAVNVYSTLVLCLAAVPVYTTAPAVLQKVTALCLTVQVSALLNLACSYLPKLYAVRFVKEGLGISSLSGRVEGRESATTFERESHLVYNIKVHPFPTPGVSSQRVN